MSISTNIMSQPHHNIIGTTSGMVFGLITPTQSMSNTIIFAAIGAVVGFVVTQFCKYIWKKIFK